MLRRIAPAALAFVIVLGCAGPSKLARQSEEQLAGGENGRAWRLAVRALDKDPGNARARAAATAAGNSIARDWEQRIHVLAQSDSIAAAGQVLDLAAFRVGAVRYAAISVSPEWASEEQAFRQTAARIHYQRGVTDLASRRPKRAWLNFADARRYVPEYRDVARLSDRAYEKALTRVAFVPFLAASGNASLGRDVAAAWRDDLARRLVPPDAHFTRVLGSAAIEQQMKASQLGRMSREDAVRFGRKAGADRVVWGSIGGVDAQTSLHLFTDLIARRIVEKDAAGTEVTRWVNTPLEVIARVRTVTVDLDYEVIATQGGATLAHQRSRRSTSARVVWTLFAPEGDLGAYALVSDIVRAAEPAREAGRDALEGRVRRQHHAATSARGATLDAELGSLRPHRPAPLHGRRGVRVPAGAAPRGGSGLCGARGLRAAAWGPGAPGRGGRGRSGDGGGRKRRPLTGTGCNLPASRLH